MLRAIMVALAFTATTAAQAGPSPAALSLRLLNEACSLPVWNAEIAQAQLPRCRKVVESFPRTDPHWARAALWQSGLELTLGNHEAALALLTAAVEAYPHDITVRLRRMQLLKGTRDAAKIMDDVQYLRATYPGDPRTWLEYGILLASFGSHQDAVAAFTTGLNLDPRNVLLLQQRAYALDAVERDSEALADVNALISIQPKNRRAYLHRAELQLRAGNPERAIADIGVVRSVGPSAGDETSLLLAEAQILTDQPREALASLDAALSSWPTNRQAHLQRKALVLRLAVLEKLDQKPEADATLSRLLEVTDKNKLLRMQVYLRNMGWAVSITGIVDGETRAALAVCLSLKACSGGILRAI